MTQQTIQTKAAALEEFFARLTRIAELMGGTASLLTSAVGFPAATVPSPRSEDAPALRVEMSSGFQVNFALSHPLSVGNALSVRRRAASEGRVRLIGLSSLGQTAGEELRLHYRTMKYVPVLRRKDRLPSTSRCN